MGEREEAFTDMAESQRGLGKVYEGLVGVVETSGVRGLPIGKPQQKRMALEVVAAKRFRICYYYQSHYLAPVFICPSLPENSASLLSFAHDRQQRPTH